MIGFLRGVIAERDADHLTLDVAGVGYRIHVPSSLSASVSVGSEAHIHTHLHVRDTEVSLYGFSDPAQRAMFENLLEVGGVGPKVALAALSAYTPAALALAISVDDIALLSSIPGVGKKTAQRIALDLKGKVAPDLTATVPAGAVSAPALSDAHAALDAMGFSAAEVSVALTGTDMDADTPTIIREALRRLGGARA